MCIEIERYTLLSRGYLCLEFDLRAHTSILVLFLCPYRTLFRAHPGKELHNHCRLLKHCCCLPKKGEIPPLVHFTFQFHLIRWKQDLFINAPVTSATISLFFSAEVGVGGEYSYEIRDFNILKMFI